MSKPKRLLVSQPGIEALLAGRKQQHRFRPKHYVRFADTPDPSEDEQAALLSQAEQLGDCHYRKGDLVWIPEAYALVPQTAYRHDPSIPHVETEDSWIIYRQGWDRSQSGIVWRPATTMPRQAARHWLRITDVVVHPVADITPGEALLEGIESRWFGYRNYLRAGHYFTRDKSYTYNDRPCTAEIMSYISLFEHQYGLDSWDRNPGVIALTWELIAGPNGQPL